MKNYPLIYSKCIFFICTFLILSTKTTAQLSQNVNKIQGTSYAGSTLGSGSSDWIYSIKANDNKPGESVATGYTTKTGVQNPVYLKITTFGGILEAGCSAIQGVGFDIHLVPKPGGDDIYIIGRGVRPSPFNDPPSMFSIKLNHGTGALDMSYGIKLYNDQTINIPTGQNGLTNTIVGELVNGKPHSRVIKRRVPILFPLPGYPTYSEVFDGFIVCGNFYDNSYPSTFASSSNITTGCFLMKLDVNGDPDPNFGTNGVQLYYQNTSTQFFGPHLHDVCVNYDANGKLVGYVAVGSINENPGTLQTRGDFNNDALVFLVDTLGNILFEDIYDETTHLKNTGSAYSPSYTDATDIALCTNWGTLVDPVIYLNQENTNEQATRVKQMGDNGEFAILTQFDFTAYTHNPPCSSTYPSAGFFIAADPAVIKMNLTPGSGKEGNIDWITNTFQSTGADFENDVLWDSTGGKVLVLGCTMQEPSNGTPTSEQAVISKIDGGSGSIDYEYVYEDVSSSQTMFCPFSFDFYSDPINSANTGIIIGGDNDIGVDDYQFIWVDPY